MGLEFALRSQGKYAMMGETSRFHMGKRETMGESLRVSGSPVKGRKAAEG